MVADVIHGVDEVLFSSGDCGFTMKRRR